MSSEELALLIQQGNRAYIQELWAQVEQFVIWKARQFERYLVGSPADFDDLKQSGYFAMLEAVKYFDPGKKIRFLTYLGYTLKNSFADTAGLRTSKRDASQYAVRLDAPVGKDKESPLIDFIEDKQAQEAFYLLNELDYIACARETIFRALKSVTARAQNLIELMYFEGLSLTEAATRAGYASKQTADSAHYDALRKIRHSGIARELYSLLDDFGDLDISSEGVKGVGVQRFRNTWESSTERAAAMLYQHNTHRQEEDRP